MEQKKPVALIILDGFGYAPNKECNAIALAHTPNLDAWFARYPHTLLKASGEAVGLLPGMIGNSEVGHMTIGTGQVIKQPATLMHEAVANGSLVNNPILKEQFARLRAAGGRLHLMGLLSDAGVHSMQEDLYAFMQSAKQNGITSIYIHPFLDGRDVAPKSALHYLTQLENTIKKIGVGVIGSVHGRFYAMDRDHNWERTRTSYEVLVQPQKVAVLEGWQKVLDDYYTQGITDEFIPPTQLNPDATIRPNDGIIFFNFRPDRARQLAAAFTDPALDAFALSHIPLTFFITPVAYGADTHTTALLKDPVVPHPLKEILSAHKKTIFSIAETEKYAHVTYFFSAGHEAPYRGETQQLIPSLHVHDYVHHPEMSAPVITHAVIHSLRSKPADFYLINYANADMVGHSGNLDATIKAVECLDTQLKLIYDQLVIKMEGTMIITADHGKAECMCDAATHQPQTAHTSNRVPFIVINGHYGDGLTLTALADIAPFILTVMKLLHKKSEQ